MKFISNLENIKRVLESVSYLVDNNPTLPVLNNILFKVAGKRLTLSATNLESAIKYSLEVQVKNEGEITIPAKTLVNYISFLEGENVEFESVGDDILVKCGKSKTKIRGLNSSEFPILPEVENLFSVKLNSDELEKALKETTFVCSVNSTRPVLSGVYFFSTEKGVNMVATDGYRLSEKQIQTEIKANKKAEVIIPARALNELQKLVKNMDELEITVGQNQVAFRVDGIELFSRLIDGNFPNYKAIIPNEFNTTVKIKTKEIISAVRQMSVFARDNNNTLNLKTSEGELNINANANQVGEGETSISAEIDGENQSINLNYDFLLSALGVMNSETVILKLKDKNSPIILQPEKEENYLHLIMPLKS